MNPELSSLRTDGSGAFTPGFGAAFERAGFDTRAAGALDDARTQELIVSAREWLAHHQAEPPLKGPPQPADFLRAKFAEQATRTESAR
jgi:hypothetical protein